MMKGRRHGPIAFFRILTTIVCVRVLTSFVFRLPLQRSENPSGAQVAYAVHVEAHILGLRR